MKQVIKNCKQLNFVITGGHILLVYIVNALTVQY
jgi:hypothetical protein